MKTLGLRVEIQKAIPVVWEDLKMDIGFRADLIIKKKVIVELKAVEKIAPVHKKTATNLFKNHRYKTKTIN